jgi:hypothetical protein
VTYVSIATPHAPLNYMPLYILYIGSPEFRVP